MLHTESARLLFFDYIQIEFSIARLKFKQPKTVVVVIIYTIRIRNALTCTNPNCDCLFLQTKHYRINIYVNLFLCFDFYCKFFFDPSGYFVHNSNRSSGRLIDSGIGLRDLYADCPHIKRMCVFLLKMLCLYRLGQIYNVNILSILNILQDL